MAESPLNSADPYGVPFLDQDDNLFVPEPLSLASNAVRRRLEGFAKQDVRSIAKAMYANQLGLDGTVVAWGTMWFQIIGYHRDPLRVDAAMTDSSMMLWWNPGGGELIETFTFHVSDVEAFEPVAPGVALGLLTAAFADQNGKHLIGDAAVFLAPRFTTNDGHLNRCALTVEHTLQAQLTERIDELLPAQVAPDGYSPSRSGSAISSDGEQEAALRAELARAPWGDRSDAWNHLHPLLREGETALQMIEARDTSGQLVWLALTNARVLLWAVGARSGLTALILPGRSATMSRPGKDGYSTFRLGPHAGAPTFIVANDFATAFNEFRDDPLRVMVIPDECTSPEVHREPPVGFQRPDADGLVETVRCAACGNSVESRARCDGCWRLVR